MQHAAASSTVQYTAHRLRSASGSSGEKNTSRHAPRLLANERATNAYVMRMDSRKSRRMKRPTIALLPDGGTDDR